MTFCLGSLLKTVKKYEIDQSKTNSTFINEFLGCACNLVEPHYFEKSAVSKILACKQNPPVMLKRHLGNEKFQEQLTNNLFDYIEENFQQNYFDDLSVEITNLFNKKNKSQLTILERLKKYNSNLLEDKENSPSETLALARFLAFALIEALKITNVVNTSRVINKHGNSCLCVSSGDIFRFGFNKKIKKKNIVVIPVNTGFDTHISRKYESQAKQIVSISTLHGTWLERMLKRSATKKKVDNSYELMDERKLKKRIFKDLEIRGFTTEADKELPIGTVAVIQEENRIFYLLAVSKFDKNNNAHATKSEIKEALGSLLKFYDKNGQGLDIYLPLIGTGMSRSGFSNQESFDAICEVFDPEKNSYVGKVTIIVLSEVYECLEFGD